jgi:hypothetical protein
MKKLIVGVLRDEQLMKNIFSGMGYFIFSGGAARVLLGGVSTDNWPVLIGLVAFLFALFSLACAFWFLYVIRPLVKISWPEFGIPGIDDHSKKLNIGELVKRVDIYAYAILGVLSIQGGSLLFKFVLKA